MRRTDSQRTHRHSRPVSQPRISRHLKLLSEAGLVERRREASWVFYSRARESRQGILVTTLLALLDLDDAQVRATASAWKRCARPAPRRHKPISPSHAARWDAIRFACARCRRGGGGARAALGAEPIDTLLDLGTGTGRMLEILADRIVKGIGIDLSPDMLGVWRGSIWNRRAFAIAWSAKAISSILRCRATVSTSFWCIRCCTSWTIRPRGARSGARAPARRAAAGGGFRAP